MQREIHEQRLDTYLARYFPSFETGGQIWTRLVQQALRPSTRILDAGAGEHGLLYKTITNPNLTRVGLDLVPLNPAHPAEHLVQANLEAIPLADASVDLVTSEFVLEHLVRPALVFREIWRVLKPGGQFIFITSNRYNPLMAFSSLSPHGLHAFLRARLLAQPVESTFPTTYSANTWSDLERLGVQAGFVQRTLYRAGNPGYFTFSRLLLRGAIAFEQVIDRPRFDWLKMYLVGHFVKPAS